MIINNEGKYFDRSQIGKLEMTIPYHSQNEKGAWVGCVPTSLLMAMQYKGLAPGMGLLDFLNNHLPRASAGNPNEGFPGTPWARDNRYCPCINPNVQVGITEKFGGRATDLTGTPLYALQDELYMDNPVVIVATLYWNAPVYRTYMVDGSAQSLVENLHVCVITGYNPANNQYKITDPYNRTTDTFMKSKGAVYGQRFDFWENGSVLEKSYNYEKKATSIWQ